MSNINYKNKWWVLLSAGLMILLINIDSTIVNVALAKISVSLNANLTLIQWVISSYLLATAIFFTICGRLADMHGNKKVFLTGTAIFTVASFLCGIAPNAGFLIGARFIQGIGFASTLGIAILLTSNAFPPDQRGLANGMSVTLTGIGQIVGPTIGGIILNYASWQWIFLVNVPIGVVCFTLSCFFAPKDIVRTDKQTLDKVSLCLFIAGLGIIATTLNEIASLQTGNIILFVAIGVAFLIAYGFRSRRAKHPMIATSLLTHAEYIKVALTRLIFMAVWSVVLLFIPLYLQNIVGFTPLKTGMLILIMTGMIAITSPITGKLIDIYGFKPLMVLSMFLTAISSLILSTFDNPPDMIWLVIAFIIFGISVGIQIPSTLNGVIRTSEAQHRSTGMGLFFTIAFLGSTIGIALSGSYMTEKSKVLTLHSLVIANINTPIASLEKLFSVASGAHDVSWMQHDVMKNTFSTLSYIAQNSFMITFAQLMWINTVLCIIGIAIAWRIKMSNLVD